MSYKTLKAGLKLLVLVLPLAILPFDRPALGEEALSVGRMRAAVWPEYDDLGVLAIYDGRFTDPNAFPAEASFLLPKGAVISDACSLSPRGQHFCQLYKVVEREKVDEVILTLPYPNFYLSFHLKPFGNGGEEKAFDYTVRANHPVETLEVEIQQPLRSTQFSVSPSGGTESLEKGFNHLNYTYKDVAKGEEKIFKISYIKKDRKPSVDIKYANTGMDGTQVVSGGGSPYETQRKIKWIVYMVFGAGVAAAAAATLLFFSRRRG